MGKDGERWEDDGTNAEIMGKPGYFLTWELFFAYIVYDASITPSPSGQSLSRE